MMDKPTSKSDRLRGVVLKISGLLVFMLPLMVQAQYYVSGQDPASIRWRQINTDNFQIIYPEDFEYQAYRVAGIFEKAYRYVGATLQHQPKKISVILHTRSLKSNGFVALAPSRMELYTIPGQDTYAQDWIEQLAIHESRHHVQVDKIDTELPFVFKALLGEQAAALVVASYLPFWFLEGDAVVTETALSQAGRGRLADFSMELKAQVNDKGIFSLDKAYLGSYKDYVPDHYQLGYQIVSGVRKKYGGDVWGQVLHQIARNPLALNSLSKGLKNAAGKNQDELYREVMQDLRSSETFGFPSGGQADNLKVGSSGGNRFYTSYRYAHFISDSSYVALKSPLDEIPYLVKCDLAGHEKKLFTPGFVMDESMNCTGNRIIWTESLPDPRWSNRDKTLLRIFDLSKGEIKDLAFRERLEAPALAQDGSSIAAVRFNDRNQCSLVFLSARDGKITREIKAIENQVFITPSWSEDQKSLYAITLDSHGKSIVRINLDDGKIVPLTPSVNGEYRKPVQHGNVLFYSSDRAGKSEGYALNLLTGRNYRVLTAKYGLKDLQPAPKGDKLIYADYTAQGFKTDIQQVLTQNWSEAGLLTVYKDSLANKLAAQESQGPVDFSSKDTAVYQGTRYSKAANLINIHSWSPFYINPDQYSANIGLSVVSQNKLATAITQFGYNYSTINQSGKWTGKFEYTGWYPVIRIDADRGNEISSYYKINRTYNSRNVLISQDTVLVKYTQHVVNLHVDLSLPLNLSRGKMFRMVAPEIQLGYSVYRQDASTPAAIFRGSYIPVTYRIYAYNLEHQSLRDVQPRWGQIIDLNFRHTPWGDRQKGTITSAETIWYLPGLANNQGFRIYGAWQQKDSPHIYFNDLISYPRGYSSIDNNRLVCLKSDYYFPLLCPDWHLWHLYYLKRLYMRVHYDYARIGSLVRDTGENITKSISSTGFELSADSHFLRFIAPVRMGFRESWQIGTGLATSEFIFSINFKGI